MLDFQPAFRAPLFHRGWGNFQQIGDGRYGVDHSTVSGALLVVADLQVNRARRCLEPLGDFHSDGVLVRFQALPFELGLMDWTTRLQEVRESGYLSSAKRRNAAVSKS